MTRRTRLAPLVTAAFLLRIAVPESPFLVHRHAGGGLEHVHVDEADEPDHDHGGGHHHAHGHHHRDDRAVDVPHGPGLGHPDDDGVAHVHARHPVVMGERALIACLAPGTCGAIIAHFPAAPPLVRLFGIAHPRGPPPPPVC